MTHTFKVGDRVRITTRSALGNKWTRLPNVARAEKGTLATVTGVQYDMVSVEWFDGLTGGISDFHPEELILVPQAYTFKKGDKVKLDPRYAWYAPANVKHAPRGTVATVTSVYPGTGFSRGKDQVSLKFPDGDFSTGNLAEQLILVQGDHVEGSEPLKETVAEIEAKIEKAVQDQARAKQDRTNAEWQKTLAEGSIADANKRDKEANDRIIAFGDQIVKLKELEEKKKWRLEPGRTVRVKASNFRFQNQYGTVDRVGGTNWVEVSGPFYDLYGKHYGFVIFRKEEVEVVR